MLSRIPLIIALLASNLVGGSVLQAKELTCSKSIRERLTLSSVDVNEAIATNDFFDNPSSLPLGERHHNIVLSPQPNGKSKVAWMDVNNTLHILNLTEYDRRGESESILKSAELRDMIAHNNGYSVIGLTQGRMRLVRAADDTTLHINRFFQGFPSRSIHQGSLAFNGTTYAANFGVSKTNHEGDSLSFMDLGGEILAGGREFGCSISVDMRVIATAHGFVTLCLSNPYPAAGFHLNYNQKLLLATKSDHRGNGNGSIGGIVEFGEFLGVAIVKKPGNPLLNTAHLMILESKPPYKTLTHVLVGNRAKEPGTLLKIAKYDSEHVLLSWYDHSSEMTQFAVYNSKGQLVTPIESSPIRAYSRSDFKTFPNGDIGWVSTWGDNKSLKIMRLAHCKD